MNQRICLQSWAPLRSMGHSKGEMVSSLLFGETCTVLASEGEWLHVRVDHDGYLGWIPDLYLGDARPFQGQSWQVVRELGAYFLGDDGDVIALSPGSKIPGERIIIDGRTYYFRLGKYLVAGAAATAKVFLNTPYLWGGRSIWGIDCSGLVQSVGRVLDISMPRDAYQQAAAFNWGQARFRIRGLDNEYGVTMINGISMNKIYDGRPQWSNWGGLNDATRNQEFTLGSAPSDYTFGGILGTQEINTRASLYRKGTRISQSGTNTNYSWRSMVTHNSGLMDNGWAYSISGSRRWADDYLSNSSTPKEAIASNIITNSLNSFQNNCINIYVLPSNSQMTAGFVPSENKKNVNINYVLDI